MPASGRLLIPSVNPGSQVPLSLMPAVCLRKKMWRRRLGHAGFLANSRLRGRCVSEGARRLSGRAPKPLVNSGSSANLVAISTLTSAKLPEQRRIKPGDEVITVAAGFPTTVAPIVQVGAVPVFIDANPITGNACCDQLEAAYSPGKTKAVMMAHALGNPFDLAATLVFVRSTTFGW